MYFGDREQKERRKEKKEKKPYRSLAVEILEEILDKKKMG